MEKYFGRSFVGLGTAVVMAFGCGASPTPAAEVPSGAHETPDASSASQHVDPRPSAADEAALIDALFGLWTPDASGSIPASAHTKFEAQLLKSQVYAPREGEPIEVDGSCEPQVDGPAKCNKAWLVFTDAASAVAYAKNPKDGHLLRGRELAPVPGVAMLRKAMQRSMPINLYTEGERGSVFTHMDLEQVRAILAKAPSK
jgi:hypothetical protein